MTEDGPDVSVGDDTAPEELLSLGRRPRRRPRRWQQPRRAERRYRAFLAPVGWVAAAVVCMIAPYRDLFSVHRVGRSGANTTTLISVDGWGDSPSDIGGTWPSINLGILLWSCAALLLVVAGIVSAAAWGSAASRIDQRWLDMLTIGVTTLLAGVVAAVVTSSYGFKRWFDARLPDTPIGPKLAVSWGGCAWLSLGGLLCAVAATVGFFLRLARDERVTGYGSQP